MAPVDRRNAEALLLFDGCCPGKLSPVGDPLNASAGARQWNDSPSREFGDELGAAITVWPQENRFSASQSPADDHSAKHASNLQIGLPAEVATTQCVVPPPTSSPRASE